MYDDDVFADVTRKCAWKVETVTCTSRRARDEGNAVSMHSVRFVCLVAAPVRF